MNFIKNVRENLKDPKKKSLTMLGIYAIFFIFVSIVLKMGDTKVPEYQVEEETNTISNYEYIYSINNNGIINEVTGTIKNNEDNFNYNGLNYIKNGGTIYLNSTPVTLDFDVDKYKYEKLELLIENNDSKTTYKESKKVTYNITMNKYFNLLNEINNCNLVDCTIINASITVERDIFINHAIIDLSNYYGYKYIIEINYNNINQIQ